MTTHSSSECPCKRLPLCLSSFTAAAYGDLHSLSKKDGRIVDAGGYTPLHLAAQHGHVSATQLLLRKGLDVDIHPNGATPLHRASFTGAVGTMRILLQHKANLISQDESFGDLMTPLHKAAAGGRPLAVQLLLLSANSISDESSKEVQEKLLRAKDSTGRTPLQVACHFAERQEEERRAVQRWDQVAGGDPADWEKCVELLRSVEEEIFGTSSSGSKNHHQTSTTIVELLPPTTTVPTERLLCEDCTSDAPCVTASWEAAFRSTLASSIPTTTTTSSKIVMKDLHLNAGKVTDNQESFSFRNEGKEESRNLTQINQDGDSLGSPCSTCRTMSFALYPVNGHLLCRTCKRRKPTRMR